MTKHFGLAIPAALVALLACANEPTTPKSAATSPPASTAPSAVGSSALAAGSSSGSALLGPADAGALDPEGTVDQLRIDARAIRPLVHTAFGLRFLDGATSLPHVATHSVYRTADKSRWLTESERAKLPESERASLVPVTVDEPLYYETKYGSPLANARAFDLLGAHGFSGREGASYADFGYGGIGALFMMAASGWRPIGIDVDPMLPAIYADATSVNARVRMLNGRFPFDPEITRAVGHGHSLFLSKNVLKRGYIHPDRPADDKFLIHLGVSDAAFLTAVHDALEPGGFFLIYNICPALTPPDKPFMPWSDGRSPFARAQFLSAGFEVLELDHDDIDAIRELARALRWDKGEDAMDLDHDLSVLYTLARRR